MKKQKFVNLPRGGYRLGSGKDNFMNTVQVETPGRNTFDLSHSVKMTGRIANLMPCFVHEVVPGDKFNLGCDILTRLAPMIAPIMDRLDVRLEYFFCPNRIVWPNAGANQGWEKFIANEPSITRPYITLDLGLTLDQENFLEWFRVPKFSDNTGAVALNINALAFAAYQKIYQDYYRPQYLENETFVPLVDGDNNAVIADLLQVRRRCYDNDYFTAALPTPQKGAAGVSIPGGEITLDPNWVTSSDPIFRDGGLSASAGNLEQNGLVPPEITVGGIGPNAYDPDGSLTTTLGTLNELREANAIQKWLEMLMRVGSRFKELIKGAFNVDVEDYRVDRPEFITGVKAPIIVSEVLNTTNDGSTPQGNMSGHGISVIEGYQDGYFAKEHGYIIGILSVMPKATYAFGIERHWLRDSPNDWYWPHFANLGEQATVNHELYAYTATGTNPFGYMPRYSELRAINDWVCGDFKPTKTLEFWTVARDFTAVPNLNRDFLDVNDSDIERIFAASGTDDYFYFHIRHMVKASRPLPVYGTPQLI